MAPGLTGWAGPVLLVGGWPGKMSSLASPEDVSVNPQFSENSKQQTIVEVDLSGIVSKPVTFSPRLHPLQMDLESETVQEPSETFWTNQLIGEGWSLTNSGQCSVRFAGASENFVSAAEKLVVAVSELSARRRRRGTRWSPQPARSSSWLPGTPVGFATILGSGRPASAEIVHSQTSLPHTLYFLT